MANKKINELDSRASLSLSDLMAVGDPSTGYLYKTTISDLKTLTGAGVISFNGRFGAVSPAEGDYSLTQLSDVIITSASNGQLLQYNGSNWVNATLDLSGYVPYTGATANVNLGTYDLTADVITGATGSFASSGGSNTFAINHSSGSGIALNITKGGNGEGLYINKTDGSGNAATIIGTLNATTLVKNGGTSSQFLKADGSVDSSTYVTTDTNQTISGVKIFSSIIYANGTVYLPAAGTASQTKLENISTVGVVNFGANSLGFNSNDNLHISSNSKGYAVFAFNNAGTGHTYTLPATTGTIALTSNIPSLTNYVTLDGTQTITGDKTYSGVNIYDGYQTRFSMGIAINNTTSGGAVGSHTVIGANVNGLQINLAGGGYNNLNFASTSAGNTYTLPNATGTIALTSDLSGYLPLSGGTLTGALSGTSTSFSSTVQASAYRLTGMTGGSGALYWSSDRVTLANYNASGLVHIEANGGTSVATFGGATYNNDFVGTGRFTGTLSGTSATFSGSVTSNGTLIAGLANGNIRLKGSADGFLGVGESNGTLYLTDWATGAKGLSIVLATGAATFSSSVTAAGVTIGDSDVRSSSNVLTLGGTSEVIRITGGNVGIGTSTPTRDAGTKSLAISGGGSLAASLDLYGNGGRNYAIYTGGSGSLGFYDLTSSAERLTITSGGKLLIGTTTAGYGLFTEQRVTINPTNDGITVAPLTQSKSAYTVQADNNTGNRYALYVANGSSSEVGSVSFTSSSVSFNTTSDYRLKQDFKEFGGLDLVSGIKTYDFEWKIDGSRSYGVIAHELQAVIPYVVMNEKDGEKMQSVDYSKIVPILVKAIQELKLEIDTLKK